MRQTIAAVLIGKDEEAMLGRCLESVKEADEIVFCDTGSTDSTVDVAANYTDKVFLVPEQVCWTPDPPNKPIFHFSNARNYAKSKATASWILSIDCDEYLLSPFSRVREAVKQVFSATDVTMISIREDTRFQFTRIFKNSPTIQWVGAAHNHVSVLGERVSDVEIIFDYSPTHQKNPERTLRILEKEVRRPDPKPRDLFYLGREYWYFKRYEDAALTLGRYVQSASRFLAEKAEAYLIMSHCFYQLGDLDSAREACAEVLIINPTWKEACLHMAKLAGEGSGVDRFERNAKQWLKMAETAENHDVLFLRTT